MNITAQTKLCLIIGDPVEHSLSPQMHNAAYEALHIDDEFVFVAATITADRLGTVIEAVKSLGIRGLSCTIPHKVAVLQYIAETCIDPVAKKIGAVNTIVNEEGILKGYNTDWIGVLTPLEKIVSLDKKKVAIVGTGGAARAMLYAITTKGASATVYNRNEDTAKKLAQEFGAEARSLHEIEHITQADIILNATPLGLHPNEDETPVPKKYIRKHHIIFDAIYSPYETRLLHEAKESGATIIRGIEMLLYQGTAQFELYTNRKAPEDIMRKILMTTFS